MRSEALLYWSYFMILIQDEFEVIDVYFHQFLLYP